MVSNEEYAKKMWWGEINHPISAETFEGIRRSLAAYLQGRDVYVLDAAAAADPAYRIPIQVITELAWHNLFARQLFLRANQDDLTSRHPGFTVLSVPNFHADPRRRLIGDDERGWSANGVVNFEGGCYAKCISLSKEYEPQIWDAIRFCAVYENVVLNPKTREPDYSDDSITENTRAAYPVDFIDNVVESGRGGHPEAVIFLSADSFGVLPPISKLTTEQTMYYFLSGYTIKLPDTPAPCPNPQPTFTPSSR